MNKPCTVEEHLERVLSGVRPLTPVATPLLDALGLVCAEDVVAAISLPSFDNSAMDGYAVRRSDVVGASAESPVSLPVVGDIGAGQATIRSLEPGTAAKIMTGAPIPEGADAVVPYEWTDRGVTEVRIDEAPEAGQHVRPAGDDVSAGDQLVAEGTVLGPRRIGLLASVGRATVMARPRPRVVILSTGSELRDPGEELGHDSIYDGNSYLLAAAVLRAGAEPVRVGIVRDEPGAFLQTLEAHLDGADLVVTSGGVSQGDYDVVKEALLREGVWFGPVAMQPGKPQGFGLVGAAKVPIVTLPGNSVSAYISFEMFVLPAIRTLMGMSPVSRPLLDARLTRGMTSPEGRRQFMRGQVGYDAQGRYVVPVGGPGSHLIGALAVANALIVVPEDAIALGQGDRVQVLVLDGEF
ncbi:MAG TPA: molybdopterin molybdotransferase MoeA [Nocardioides sp.]|uniref:molybdotransferase-like divisome protein Glp n=1 Tax=uncultured Nocardioides sp. TaxID=198441 RepID=UPI000EED9943|nr:gephyrin-like molybdotransferase Glp [uncultured Nocardioides sp.]HCB03213.1 molybdopterin molybdenumtransferase MoeA [Nocardioides sp.]HRD61165.1 molybdopterin molybdotransferase MoeA [Nocardioides sp.]HRI97187.1 molybdopterin molybdotransferase MoeA [Nocardioides sp.]